MLCIPAYHRYAGMHITHSLAAGAMSKKINFIKKKYMYVL